MWRFVYGGCKERLARKVVLGIRKGAGGSCPCVNWPVPVSCIPVLVPA